MLIQINIDTQDLSKTDKEILAFLGGSEKDFVVHSSPEDASEPDAPAKAKPAPAKKEEPAPAKAKPAPAKKEEPAPAKEEPVEEPVEKPKPTAKKAAQAGDGPTMAQAVEIATKLVSENKTAEVKAALQAQGVRRVSELKDSEQIAAFIEAVEAI